MKIIDFGPDAHGFIAIGEQATGVIAVGQIATGIFALGQMATGVVAVGQLARGCFVVGQLAVGWFGLGQLTLAPFFGVGMVGVAGRGFGLVIPMIPSLGPTFELPDTTSVEAVLRGTPGWVRVELVAVDGIARACRPGTTEPIPGLRLDARLRKAADGVLGTPVMARVETADVGPVIVQLREIPASRLSQRGWWGWWAVQTVGLLALVIAWWGIVGVPLVRVIVGRGGIFF